MAESYQTNLLNVASFYIKQLKVPITITSLKQNLEENPYYPSLFSLSNTFERFHIPHEAVKIAKENFEQLTPPFVAYLKNQPTGKDFVLVTSVTENEVLYIAENKKPKKVSKEVFLKNWENIILQAGPDEKSGEKDYSLNHKKEIVATNKTTALIAVSVLIFLSTLFFFLHSLPINFIISASVLLIIKTLGLAATTLLLIYEIDKSNAFVKSICTTGKQTNCNAVLQSNASKILGMSWSEAGFFYFASTLLFLWFPGISFTTKIFILSLGNCIAAQYILFSVYYQWKVVKQWCPLCLAVQTILLSELVWAITSFWKLPFLPAAAKLSSLILPFIYCLLLAIIIWYVAKPLLLKAKKERIFKTAYKRFLYNPDRFNSLLQQQVSAPEGYQNMGITIGNPEAANLIIKVCNPNCGPCAAAHPILHEIIHRNKNVKLKLIFVATNGEKDLRGLVARHFLAIDKQNSLKTPQALDDWYLSPKKDYEEFSKKYPMNSELKMQEKQIDDMRAWCDEAGVTGTPTFFINGKRLPGNYSINELKYIL